MCRAIIYVSLTKQTIFVANQNIMVSSIKTPIQSSLIKKHNRICQTTTFMAMHEYSFSCTSNSTCTDALMFDGKVLPPWTGKIVKHFGLPLLKTRETFPGQIPSSQVQTRNPASENREGKKEMRFSIRRPIKLSHVHS
jgi:hypothetical protein